MACVDGFGLASAGIPDMNGTVQADGRNRLSVGGPGKHCDASTVFPIDTGTVASGRSTDLNGSIPSAIGDALLIWRPCDCIDCVGAMAFVFRLTGRYQLY